MATRLSLTNKKFKTDALSGSNFYQNTMGNSKNFDNSLYDSGELQNYINIPSNYHFKERSGRLKWKEIMKLDIEVIIRSGDLAPLENYLENLIFSSIEECDLEQLPDVYVVKLIKIFQYIMEYLLYTQQRLEIDNKTLESKYTLLVNDAYNKEAALKENKILLNTLKKDKKEKEMVLHTYKCLIDEYKLGKIPRADNDNLKVSAETSKRYFYCDMCQGKKFSSQQNLDAHINRRHTKVREDFSVTRKIPEPVEKSSNLDDKFDEMKSFFESYVKNFAQESYLKIFENQKNLESKIYEIKFDKLNEVKEMENQFKNTLMEMKELYLKSSVNMGQMGNSLTNHQMNMGNNLNSNNSLDQDKAYENIKNETQKMSEILTEINRDQNQKIQNLVEQINSFKSTLNEEFNEIKLISRKTEDEKLEKKREKELLKEMKKSKKKVKEENSENVDVPKKEFKPTISHIASIEFNIESDKRILAIPNQTENKIIIEKPKKKIIFNAGPLESDYNSDVEKSKRFSLIKNNTYEFERKFSFAEESLKLETHRKQSNKNSVYIPIDKEEAEGTIPEKNVSNDIEKEKEQINIEIIKIVDNEIYQDEFEKDLEEPEDQYKPAELSLKNKIFENLKSFDEIEKPVRLDTIGNVTEADIKLDRSSDIENKNFIQEVKDIPEMKNNNTIKKEEDGVSDQPEIINDNVQPINPVINEREKEIRALKRIEEFYTKMEERDSNSIEKNDAYLYANKILATNSNDEIQITKKLSEILNNNTEKFVNSKREGNTIEFNKISQHSHEDIINLIDNLLININNNSKDRAYLQEFYTRLDSTIGLTELTKSVQHYKQHKTILPVPSNNNNSTKGPYKRHQSAIIMNNLSSREDMDFKNKPQIIMKQNTFLMQHEIKSENEKINLDIEDLDDEFDHTK